MQAVKFLILRFSSIGDVILTTPIIRGLKEQVEHAEIHFFTKPAYREILAANPYVDKLHVLHDDLNQQLKELDKEEFDYIIDLHKNLRTFKVKSKLKRVSLSFDKLNFQKWLMVNFKWDRLPDKHIVDRYYEVVEVFDVKDDQKGLDYFIPPEDEVDVSELFPEAYSNGYLGIVLGANHNTKKLTDEKINAVIDSLEVPVVLMGGKEDETFGETIRNNHKEKVYNACGRFRINQSASLVKQARVILSPDTGLMHMAAALKVPLVTVWGNTIPEFGMYPYYPNAHSAIFEMKDLGCRPCSKLGFKECPKKHFRCINDLDTQKIVTKIKEFWKK